MYLRGKSVCVIFKRVVEIPDSPGYWQSTFGQSSIKSKIITIMLNILLIFFSQDHCYDHCSVMDKITALSRWLLCHGQNNYSVVAKVTLPWWRSLSWSRSLLGQGQDYCSDSVETLLVKSTALLWSWPLLCYGQDHFTVIVKSTTLSLSRSSLCLGQDHFSIMAKSLSVMVKITTLHWSRLLFCHGQDHCSTSVKMLFYSKITAPS